MSASNLRLSYESLLSLTKELSFLLRSGVPLYRALQIIRQQSRETQLNILLDDFIREISEGSSFSGCLAKYPKVFSQFYRQMIIVGENKGELESSLERIERYLESQKALREKIIGAVTYPVILLVLGFLVLLGMLIFVFPRFAEVFVTAGVALPLPTRLVMGFHDFVSRYYLYIFGVLAAGGGGYLFLLQKTKVRLYIHAKRLHYPVFGNLFLTIALARFTRTLGTLYAGGVQLIEALNLSKAVVVNSALLRELDTVISSVRDGKGMSKPLSRSVFFPPLLNQMVAIGEESGSLDKVLLECAEYYEQETEFLFKRYLALLEPFSLLLIAGFVMLIAAAVMLPLFRMSTAMRM